MSILNEKELLSFGLSRATVAVLRDAVDKTQETQLTLSTGELESLVMTINTQQTKISAMVGDIDELKLQLAGAGSDTKLKYLEQQNEALQLLILGGSNYDSVISDINSRLKDVESMVY